MTGALSAAERSYPTSEVRSRSWEDPMPEGWWPSRVTNIRGQGSDREELPHVEVSAVARRSYLGPEARDSSWEEPPRARGQGLRLGGATPFLRSGGCAGAEGPRGAILR